MKKHNRDKILFYFAFIVGLGVWIIFIFRADANVKVANKLCGTLAAVIQQQANAVGTPHAPGYQYFRLHPDELAFAKQQYHLFLKELGCKPVPISHPFSETGNAR